MDSRPMAKGSKKLDAHKIDASSLELETSIYPHQAEQSRFSSIEGLIEQDTKARQVPPVDPLKLYEAGLLLTFKNEFTQAQELLDQAYRLFLGTKDFLDAIRCLIEMAWIKHRQGGDEAVTKANRLFTEAESMIRAHINDSGINDLRARLLHYRGLIHYREGNFGEGVRNFKIAKTYATPDGLESAKILDSFGIYYERTGDLQRAIYSLKSSLNLKEKMHIPYEEAITRQILGRIYVTNEEFHLGHQYLVSALKLSEQLTDYKRVSSLKNELIKLSIQQGDLPLAESLILENEALTKKHEFKTQLGMTCLFKAYLLYARKELTPCLTLLHKESIPIFKKMKYKKGLGMAYRLQGCVEFQLGDPAKAIESMSEAISIFKDENRLEELAKTHFELGKLFWEMGKKSQALTGMMEALKLAELNGLNYLTSYIEDEIYRIDLKKWQEIVQKRANYERIFDKDHTLLDALSALSEESDKKPVSDKTSSLISLLRVGQAMAGEQDLEKLLCTIKDETERALTADRCTVFLYDRERNELWSKVASGLKGTEEIRFPAHLGLAGYVAKTGEVLNIKNAYDDPRFNKEVDKKTGYKTENLLCMPMKNRKMEIIGVFQVLNKANGHFKRVDEDLLKAISASAGVAIENAQLAKEQKVGFESFIKTLSSTIDARDPITAGHSERVAEYSLVLGEDMQLTDEDLEALKYASLLHDIGKIGIKEEILVKDGRLTEKEYRHIQKHAYYTYEILKNIHFERHLQSVPEIAASHHEKMDGTGYFRGLKGPSIPLSGRILAMSDVFDAITSRRHYRNRMPFDKVLGILKRDSGSHFDPDCVMTFFNLKLADISRILILERKLELPDHGNSLLIELDKKITIREYDQILTKEKMTKGEADVHRAFSTLYHHNYISYLD